jgi:hypothetical protein
MIITLSKFGTTLTSRQTGREAFAAFQPVLKEIKPDENVEVDFSGVITFAPSWGDEFLRPLFEQYKDKLILRNTENLSVQATLDILEKIGGIKFNVV